MGEGRHARQRLVGARVVQHELLDRAKVLLVRVDRVPARLRALPFKFKDHNSSTRR